MIKNIAGQILIWSEDYVGKQWKPEYKSSLKIRITSPTVTFLFLRK